MPRATAEQSSDIEIREVTTIEEYDARAFVCSAKYSACPIWKSRRAGI